MVANPATSGERRDPLVRACQRARETLTLYLSNLYGGFRAKQPACTLGAASNCLIAWYQPYTCTGMLRSFHTALPRLPL